MIHPRVPGPFDFLCCEDMQDSMDVERDLIDPLLPNMATTVPSAQGDVPGNIEIVSDQPLKNVIIGGIKMNTGSYRKRKAKKQVGVELTLEDLRGKSIDRHFLLVNFLAFLNHNFHFFANPLER